MTNTKLSMIAPALMTLTVALVGCGGTSQTGLETVHQPVVQRTDFAFDLQTSGSGGLASGEIRRLGDWFESINVGYGDRISIDDPSSYGSAESRDAVASVAARHGLLLADSAPVTAGRINDGFVRVVVSRNTASVPECPDWSRASQPEYQASSMSNYGCATNVNLAAMIANPEDLIRGQAGTTDQRVSSKAIKTFRDQANTGTALKSESTGGK